MKPQTTEIEKNFIHGPDFSLKKTTYSKIGLYSNFHSKTTSCDGSVVIKRRMDLILSWAEFLQFQNQEIWVCPDTFKSYDMVVISAEYCPLYSLASFMIHLKERVT